MRLRNSIAGSGDATTDLMLHSVTRSASQRPRNRGRILTRSSRVYDLRISLTLPGIHETSQAITTMSKSRKDPINLLRGWPANTLLPADLLRTAAQKVLSDPKISAPALWYGPDAGYEPLRANIAEWLTSFYTPPASLGPIGAERVCITGGASQNLGCMLSVYTDPEYTRNIWIIAPAYFLAFRIFEDAGFGVDRKMRSVPEDESGVDMKYLRREIGESEKEANEKAKRDGLEDRPRYKPERTRAKVYKHVIYCVPTFSNPSSRTMSLERRKELVRLAREFDALIVCDDVYDFLQWPADSSDTTWSTALERMKTAHLPRLVDVDRSIDGGAEREDADGFGNACSNGTFSKIAGPGIRVGWVEGTKKFAYGISQTGTTCSGGTPQLTSTYVSQLLSTGQLQSYLHKTLLPAYALRYNILMNAIKTHLIPLGFTVPQPDRDIIGGYFAWLTLPANLRISAKTLAKKCIEEENVVIAGGNIFEVPGDNDREETKFDRNVRLCWAWEEETKLEEAMKRVARIVKTAIEGGESDSEDFVVVTKEGIGGGMVEEFK